LTIAGRVVRSAIISSLSGYGLQIITLLSGMILTRLLTQEQFGAFGLAMAISLFFSRIRLWGFESLLLAKTEPDDLDISTQFWLNCVLGLLTILLIALAAPLLRLRYDPYLVNLTLYVTAISLFESFGITSTLDAMLARDLRYGTISSLSVTATLLGIAVTICGFCSISLPR
jgi:O-antigen/teichoic acid export membrane protein